MTYVVNESCIRCKTMDCVEACPVDCFYEGENMLVIHPDECIDCSVCVPECPVDAIQPDTHPGLEKWLSLNAEYAKIWPKITVKKALPPDFKEWVGGEAKQTPIFFAKSWLGRLKSFRALAPGQRVPPLCRPMKKTDQSDCCQSADMDALLRGLPAINSAACRCQRRAARQRRIWFD